MPAIQALKTAVTLARTEDTVVTGTTRYDSKYNGLVANAHELVPGLLLAWIASLEKHGVTNVELSDCAVGGGPLWLQSYKVQHAGRWVDSVPQSWGRQCGGASAEFGETVSVVSFVGLNRKFPKRCRATSVSNGDARPRRQAMVKSVAFTGRVRADRAETQLGATSASTEASVSDHTYCNIMLGPTVGCKACSSKKKRQSLARVPNETGKVHRGRGGSAGARDGGSTTSLVARSRNDDCCETRRSCNGCVAGGEARLEAADAQTAAS